MDTIEVITLSMLNLYDMAELEEPVYIEGEREGG